MYYVVYGILYLISLIPFRILYVIADLVYLLVYYVIGYRKQVVYQNLAVAFPEKTPEERKKIAKEFYHNFIDTLLEAIKLLSISKKEMNRRFNADAGVINDYMKSGRTIQLHLGHFFNWEFANLAFSSQVHYPLLVVYMPINNKTIDRIFNKLRSRFGAHLLNARRFKDSIAPYAGSQYGLVLVGDQNPGDPSKAYWTGFFGKETPVMKGPEHGARVNDYPVFFAHFYKVKRGYYRSEVKLFTDHPALLPEGTITRELMKFIEDKLRSHPANYLWSHRRWKHPWKEEYAPLWVDSVLAAS
jgi:Kdo2-lipid IVA lauroyltransferase/acyltransferase